LRQGLKTGLKNGKGFTGEKEIFLQIRIQKRKPKGRIINSSEEKPIQ
jgi:hypothetical protein